MAFPGTEMDDPAGLAASVWAGSLQTFCNIPPFHPAVFSIVLRMKFASAVHHPSIVQDKHIPG